MIDEETAPVVKQMFDLTLAGKRTQQIAEILEEEKGGISRLSDAV